MKNKTLWDSIRCAAKGIAYALKTEKNFKYYTVIALLFLVVNLCMGVGLLQHVIYFLVCCLVFGMEFLNTAIEHLVNSAYKEFDPEAGRIKDMAAGAVLIMGLGFFFMEGIYVAMAILK